MPTFIILHNIAGLFAENFGVELFRCCEYIKVFVVGCIYCRTPYMELQQRAASRHSPI